MSKIALGTVQFGMNYGISNNSGKPSSINVKKILDFAFKNGINTIDTASGYGDSEKILGKCDVGKYNIISKFLPTDIDSDIKVSFNSSLKKLRVSQLYGYLAHRADSIDEKTWGILQDLKSDGKINKLGYSLQSPKEYDLITTKGFFPDLVQVPFNLFDKRFKELCIELKRNGVEIHTRSTYLQGLFFLDKDQFNDYFKPIKNLVIQVQNTYGANLSTVLLQYVLQQDFIDKVVIGVQSQDQLAQNLNGLDKTISIPEINYSISENYLNPALWEKS